MSETAPVAPTTEPNTPTVPAPEGTASAPEQPAQAQNAQPATTPESGTPNNYFTNEQLEEMQRFIANNGGYEKVWSAAKQAITAPKTQKVAADEPQVRPQPQQPTQPQIEVQQPSQSQYAPGSMSMEEMAALTYFERLANDPKYAPISDEIRSGAVLKGLKDFNITPVSDGRINDADVRKYLDLYVATKPATPTSVTPAEASHPDYYQVPDNKITTREQADQIQLQDIQLRSQGLAGHPMAEQAKEFIKNYYQKRKK